MVLKKLGKRLKKAKEKKKKEKKEPETIILPRFTTLQLGAKQPGRTPFKPYSRRRTVQEDYAIRDDYTKRKREIRREDEVERRRRGEEESKAKVVVDKESRAREAGVSKKESEKEKAIIQEEFKTGETPTEGEAEIRKRIKESPFKLKFGTVNIGKLTSGAEQVKPKIPQISQLRNERDISKKSTIQETKTPETIKLLRQVNRVVPLVTITQGVEKKVVAYATIKWKEDTQELVYSVHEPNLSDKEEELLTEIKDILREKLNVDFAKIRGAQAYNYIITEFNKVVDKIGLDLTPDQRLKFNYYIYRDFIGLSRLEPLMHDTDIEDISCVGYGVPIFIYHRDPLFNQIVTDVVFKSKEELDSFVLKLAQKCGKNLTLTKPLMDGALPDGSRVQATLGIKEIARRGSNFTIRKFTEKPMTPVDLINYNTVTPEILTYLWLAIEHNLSVLVSGATATGKTTFLNALSLFIKPEFKIISIEDTAELRLPHPNWIAEVARQGFGGEKYGEITMYELLKSGLRQRPDYIIVGEVRGEEATVMFQGMATGHASLGTIHADSMPAVIDRLTNKPIDLPKPMLDNLDIVVFLEKFKVKGRFIRKVKEIAEIVGYDYKQKELVSNSAFRWSQDKEDFKSFDSVILDRVREKGGYKLNELRQDIQRRIKLINHMVKENVTDYRKFSTYVSKYYNNPSFVDKL